MTTYSVAPSVFPLQPWSVEVHEDGTQVNTLYFETREQAERWAEAARAAQEDAS